MHFYMFNPADFNNSARHLSLVERAIYRDLIDMYYGNEQAIDGTNMDKLARRLMCDSEEYRASLEYVLDEFFVKRGKKYHHHRIDKEIKAYQYKNKKQSSHNDVTLGQGNVTQGVTLNQSSVTHDVTPCHNDVTQDDVTMTATERQRKSRQERRDMIKALTDTGVNVDKSIKAAELRELFASHIDDVTNDDSMTVTQGVTSSHTQCHESHAKNAAITSNYELETNNQKLKRESESTHTQSATVLNNSVDNIKQQQDTKPQPTATDPTVTDKTQIQQQKVSGGDSIQNWQPPSLDDMRSELFGAGILIQLDEQSYAKHLRDFKTYYTTKPIDPGLRQLRLVQWLKREANNQKSNIAQPRQPQGIDNKDWSQVGQASSSYDSDLPPAFHPSHKQFSDTTKSSPVAPASQDWYWKDPLPDMSIPETENYIKARRQGGETPKQTYDRVIVELQGENA